MEAYLYESLEDGKVKCNLCSHRCVIKAGRRGKCSVRENQAGTLHTLVYEKVIARHVDPIEKKPLFHFLPGTLSYSVATVGCNFRCKFCQNADIAQMPVDHQGAIMGDTVTPDEVVAAAEKSGCRSIAYTYTEPTIFFEYANDTAEQARRHGLANLLVASGAEVGVALHSGTYASVYGPAYETKAEIGMLRRAGCDAVGMSTAPETVLLSRLGVKPVGLSCITNPSRETGQPELSHAEVVEVGGMVRERLAKLLLAFLPRLAAQMAAGPSA